MKLKFEIFPTTEAIDEFIADKRKKKILVDIKGLQYHAGSKSHAMWWYETQVGSNITEV